ncbi:putative S-adenosylmethionine-dependent methyltransferase [Aspergillus undulatus]|uniref:putative S-adenosylmethionine-dependent methyltransferase n=1 Tax=Aspergillus undulatus TaxID=1810928 RepID=UPI003CCD1E34
MAQNTPSESHPTHLSPSELGTKEYWETFYSRTLTHISTKHGRDETAQPPTTQEDKDEQSDYDDDASADGDSDPGTSWFSEHNAPAKVLAFLTEESFPLAPVNTLPPSPSPISSSTDTGCKRRGRKKGAPLDPEAKHSQPTILDLGTGNGSMLALLRKRGGFAGDMVGVDYSGKSVELARELQDRRGHEAYQTDPEDEDESDFEEENENEQDDDGAESVDEWDPILFSEWDILSPSTPSDLQNKAVSWFPYDKGGFDIVLDKGTFDAVSLMAEKSETERYPGIAGGLVRRGGFLVVTSCNWTEEEVVRWFTGARLVGVDAKAEDEGENSNGNGKLVVWGRVQYPRFRFGGQEGQGVCTVCFQRV